LSDRTSPSIKSSFVDPYSNTKHSPQLQQCTAYVRPRLSRPRVPAPRHTSQRRATCFPHHLFVCPNMKWLMGVHLFTSTYACRQTPHITHTPWCHPAIPPTQVMKAVLMFVSIAHGRGPTPGIAMRSPCGATALPRGTDQLHDPSMAQRVTNGTSCRQESRIVKHCQLRS